MPETTARARRCDSWAIQKRDGSVVPFRYDKVKGVVIKCLVEGMKRPEAEAEEPARRVADGVMRILTARKPDPITVEYVQDLVIQQLWAIDEMDAAKHFMLYRERRRLEREERPVDPEAARAFREDAARFPTQLQYYQFISKFSRWREADRRRETWSEANARVFDWFATLPAYRRLTADEVSWLRGMMLDMKASPALRVLQMAGPALERCHMGVYNCSGHPIIDLFAFSELLYILMQGSGGAFSVESEFISQLPAVRRQKRLRPGEVVPVRLIEDSTEGWCDALHEGLKAWFSGRDLRFDYSAIRPRGAKLKIKGGRASGPEPLRELLDFARALVLAAQGRRLTDLEVHDLCCKIGRIVQVGGVRRAACMSLSDLNSQLMRECKHGRWWEAANHRSMANNSAVYDFDGLPPVEVFMDEMNALLRSKSGERGIFNRRAALKNRPARRKKAVFICNACAEINFRCFGLCNLTIAVVKGHESEEELLEKVRAATYFGVLQSTATRFRYVRDQWRKNAEEERLLGVDIMGHLDHPLLRPGAPGRGELVARLKQAVADTAQDLAARFGINYSAANTCLKPGGDSGVLFASCTLGGYPARHQIRRVREQMVSPVTKLLREQGVPFQPDPVNPELAVFDFLRENPEGCVTEEEMSAVEQLENWFFWKTTWAEHSCSVTVHVREHEWPAVFAWLYQPEHFEHLSGVSFLPFDGHTYKAAPNERLTKERYDELAAQFPKIDWSRLVRYEDDDMTAPQNAVACSAGGCEL